MGIEPTFDPGRRDPGYEAKQGVLAALLEFPDSNIYATYYKKKSHFLDHD